MHRNDVGVLQTGGELDLTEKTVGAERLGELGMEHLECHRAVVAKVVGQVHHSHPASAELAVDAVVLRECRLQTSQQTGQDVLGRCGSMLHVCHFRDQSITGGQAVGDAGECQRAGDTALLRACLTP